MSYLNSILSSIGGDKQSPATPAVQAPPRTQSPRTVTNGATIDGGVGGSAPPAKRKAESDTGDVSNKVPRKDVSSTGPRAPVSTAPKPPMKPSASGTPYQGTSRPSSTGPVASRPLPPTSKPSFSGPLAGAAATGAAPKKGSFAEVMARAKAAQQSAPSLGVIKHKPAEKMSRKERLAKEQEEFKKKRQEIKDAKTSQQKRSKSPEKGKNVAGVTQKPKRPPVDLGYKGTMRPSVNTSTYKGTMRPGASAPRSPATKPKDKVRMAGYASYSEVSDDEMHSDDWDDDLSDMEAGAFEMEEEEMLSLRVAKKEDEAALKEENELKRRKLERKNLSGRR